MNVLSPREWGAQVDYDTWHDPFTPDDGVALHHGGGSNYLAGVEPYTVDKEALQLQVWENYHLEKGWRGLAYGWGIGQTGTVYRIRGFNSYGAHLGDVDGDGIANNSEIVPVIWIASGDHHRPSPAFHEAFEWLRVNIIQPASPLALYLWGHREIQDKPTRCPGVNGMTYVAAHRHVVGDTVFTDHEIQELKRLVASLDSVDSNGGFAAEAVRLIRKEREHPIDQKVSKGETVVIKGYAV